MREGEKKADLLSYWRGEGKKKEERERGEEEEEEVEEEEIIS